MCLALHINCCLHIGLSTFHANLVCYSFLMDEMQASVPDMTLVSFFQRACPVSWPYCGLAMQLSCI